MDPETTQVTLVAQQAPTTPTTPPTLWQRLLAGITVALQWIGALALLVGAGAAIVFGLNPLRRINNQKVDDSLDRDDAEADRAVVDAAVRRDEEITRVVTDQSKRAQEAQAVVVKDSERILQDDQTALLRRLLEAGRRAQEDAQRSQDPGGTNGRTEWTNDK